MTQLSIIFLGTGGSWPTVKRNVTSIAIKRESEITLFDCGEGTQRQFQKSNLSYMQINKVFISHFHGDHFLGLPGLVQTMQLNDREKPLHIYGPSGMIELGTRLLTLGYFKPNYQIILHEYEKEEEIDFKDYKIKPFQVDHNIPAYGFVYQENMRPGRFDKPKALKLGVPEGPLFSKLQKGNNVTLENGEKITPEMVMGPSRQGRKIVISGDTKPCKNTIKHAENADVLIHEATFNSEIKDANKYGHSTAAQAAEIAKNADVKKLFLTHISPRYNNHNEILDEAKKVFKKSFVPNDFYKTEVKLKK
jgi:ribonuclease Z